MDEWIFLILTCGFILYFVVLLLEFNRPSQKLMEQIDNQEVRRQDMQRRLSHAQEQTEEMKGRLAKLEHDMDDLEAKRKDILPEANKRLMVHIPAGPFTMGGRDEDSPRSERPAHTIYSRPTTSVRRRLLTRIIASLSSAPGADPLAARHLPPRRR